MKTTIDLPDALVKEVKLLAVMEGKKLKDEMADLLRKGLAASPRKPTEVPSPDAETMRRRGEVFDKFMTGEWSVEFEGYEEAKAAEREKELRTAALWRE